MQRQFHQKPILCIYVYIYTCIFIVRGGSHVLKVAHEKLMDLSAHLLMHIFKADYFKSIW